MELLIEKQKLDVLQQCTTGYGWPEDLHCIAKAIESFESETDSEDLIRVSRSFRKSIPLFVTFLSKEYLNVGYVWLSRIKKITLKQCLVIAADVETKVYLDSVNQPNCQIKLEEYKKSNKPFYSKTGFTKKGLSITSLKYSIVKVLLEKGFDVFMVDIDAIIMTDLPLKRFSNIDIAFQRVYYFPEPIAKIWGFAACSGFVWLKSNTGTIDFIKKTINRQLKVYSDQIALNIALWESEIKWIYQKSIIHEKYHKKERKEFFIKNHEKEIIGVSKINNLKISALPTSLYWRNDFVPFKSSGVYVFHPNSPKSEREKIEIFKKYIII